MTISASTTNIADENFLWNHQSLLRGLSKVTHFSRQEIDALGIIYLKLLDEFSVKREQMDRSQLRAFFHSTLEIADDFIIDRAFLYFDKIQTPFITLETWIKTLSLLLRGTLNEKIKYCFFIYDLNGSGKIKRSDVVKFLRKCFVSKRTEDVEVMVKGLTDILMRKLDIDGDGEISYADYSESVNEQYELLEVFGRCLPDLNSSLEFMQTFTSDLPI